MSGRQLLEANEKHPSLISIRRSFDFACERYADLGVDVKRRLKVLETIPISLQCWQGDDVQGFEKREAFSGKGSGFLATGNYPGKARTPEELRGDLERTFSLIPGKHRLNLHACYGEFGSKKVERNEIGPEHFKGWMAWARENGLGLDFNPTLFAHSKAADGWTLSHRDKDIRQFWIEHCIRAREIGAAFGRALGRPCITNVWIPDGMKDTPVDRASPRARLAGSLDAIFKKPISPKLNLDAIEPKLFGIGSESYVVGSHEFYLSYALSRKKLLTLDSGHFHPTESIADKISSLLLFMPELLLHVSRGVRWDSDHIVILNDDLQAIAREIAATDFPGRIHIGLDYFDASVNRVAAWTIGARNMLRALLMALLEPVEKLRAAEAAGDYTTRLALQEEIKTLPSGAVWDFYCESKGVPVGKNWLAEVKSYEKNVLSKRR